MINALKYRADPTGNADSHNAIQTAFDIADRLGHRRVYVPPGDYLVSDTLNIPGGVTLEGEGSNFNDFRTRLKWINEAEAGLNFEGHDICLRGLYLDGDFKVNRLVQNKGKHCMVVDNCYFKQPVQDGSGSGIWAGGVIYPQIRNSLFNDIGMARGIDMIESNWDEDGGYYGGNVGMIEKCLLYCKMASIRFSGTITISDCSIEGKLGGDNAAIDIGDHSHGNVRILNNYFELIRHPNGHQLKAIAFSAVPGGVTIDGNVIFGAISAPDSIAIDASPYAYQLNVTDNTIARWNTGVNLKGPSQASVFCEKNKFVSVKHLYGGDFSPGSDQQMFHTRMFSIRDGGGFYNGEHFVGEFTGGTPESHAWTRVGPNADGDINLQRGRHFVVEIPKADGTITASNPLPGMAFTIHYKVSASFLGEQFNDNQAVPYVVDVDGEIRRVV